MTAEAKLSAPRVIDRKNEKEDLLIEIPVEVMNHSLKPAPPALTEPGRQPWKQQTGNPDEQNIKQGDPKKAKFLCPSHITPMPNSSA